MSNNLVKRTERGWAGHFICANRCRFRRNTLLEYKNKKFVVSTVGLLEKYFPKNSEGFEKIGVNRYYETMVFESLYDKYDDADIRKQLSFESSWAINNCKEYSDIEANNMHEIVVEEISKKLLQNLV